MSSYIRNTPWCTAIANGRSLLQVAQDAHEMIEGAREWDPQEHEDDIRLLTCAYDHWEDGHAGYDEAVYHLIAEVLREESSRCIWGGVR